MTLREKQSLFVSLSARFIVWAESQGYQFTYAEAYRTPEQAARNAANGVGIRNSLHTDRLALDLNLFRDGVYLARTEDWQALGEYWESLNSLCRWGGRFSKPDGNHISLFHGGRA